MGDRIKACGAWTVFLRSGFTSPEGGTHVTVEVSGPPEDHARLTARIAVLLAWEDRIREAMEEARTALRNSGDGSEEVLDAEDGLCEAINAMKNYGTTGAPDWMVGL